MLAKPFCTRGGITASLELSCFFSTLFDLVDNRCEVRSVDVGHGEVACDFHITALLVEGNGLALAQAAEPARPQGLGVAEVLLDFLVRWNREVGCEVALQHGLAGVAREVVLDGVAPQHVEREGLVGESPVDLFCLVREGLVLLCEPPSSVAVHDDDRLPAAVEPVFWFCLGEEVPPSPDERHRVRHLVLPEFREELPEDGAVGRSFAVDLHADHRGRTLALPDDRVEGGLLDSVDACGPPQLLRLLPPMLLPVQRGLWELLGDAGSSAALVDGTQGGGHEGGNAPQAERERAQSQGAQRVDRERCGDFAYSVQWCVVRDGDLAATQVGIREGGDRAQDGSLVLLCDELAERVVPDAGVLVGSEREEHVGRWLDSDEPAACVHAELGCLRGVQSKLTQEVADAGAIVRYPDRPGSSEDRQDKR